MPGWLGAIAEWNPLSATADGGPGTVRQPGVGRRQSWVAEHAVLMAVVWPVVLVAIFLPLSIRAYANLSR